jgi:receptor protein-tyrosine kinase
VSGSANTRKHLVERAFQAMGGAPAPGLPQRAAGTEAVATALPDAALAAEAPPRPAAGGPRPTPAAGPAAPRPLISPPSFERMRDAGLVIAPGGAIRLRLAEEFSVVQHQVLRTIRTMEPPAEGSGRARRVVMITSARPGEGKTFCSLNLAVSIAQGRSAPVLLVDADGKPGSLSDLLGLGQAPGLRLLAADPSQPPAPLLVPTEQRNLSILPYGTAVPGSAVVPPGTTVAMAVQRLAALLPQHVIVLDTPPCLSTSDPSSLAPVAGQVLLVVEAEQTQRSEVEAALDMVEACPILQLMLNQSRQNSTDTFGAYGAYGGYGVYGGDAQKSDAAA